MTPELIALDMDGTLLDREHAVSPRAQAAIGALHGGGAEVILLPEIPYDPARIAAKVESRVKHGRRYSIVVVSEGARRPKGEQVFQSEINVSTGKKRLGGLSYTIAEELREHVDLAVRNVVLGHTQRGGTPSPYDRILATALGAEAVRLLAEDTHGVMVALKGTAIKSVPLSTPAGRIKRVNPKGQLVRTARQLGISFAAADGSDDPWADRRDRHGAP